VVFACSSISRTGEVIVIVFAKSLSSHPLLKDLRLMKTLFRKDTILMIPTDACITRDQPVPRVLDDSVFEPVVEVLFT
jgi:hypothetical protein